MLVSATNKHWVADLRMNGTVRSFVFSRDGKYLYTFGGIKERKKERKIFFLITGSQAMGTFTSGM